MKVKVSFELDLSEHPGFNAPNINSLAGGIQNLSQFFYSLHQNNLVKLQKMIAQTEALNLDEAIKSSVIQHCEYNCAISEQLFNNFSVSGLTDDNHSFEFNHQEPGYKEKWTIDGKEVQ